MAKRDRLKEMVEIERLFSYPDKVPRIVEYYDDKISSLQKKLNKLEGLNEELMGARMSCVQERAKLRKKLKDAEINMLLYKGHWHNAKKRVQQLDDKLQKISAIKNWEN